jgi:hypothetical protein
MQEEHHPGPGDGVELVDALGHPEETSRRYRLEVPLESIARRLPQELGR